MYSREKNWIESEKMGAFLSVSQGSAEPPVFLEIDYKHADIKEPVALVGKGITFDRYRLSKYLISFYAPNFEKVGSILVSACACVRPSIRSSFRPFKKKIKLGFINFIYGFLVKK